MIHHSNPLTTKDYNRIKEIFEKLPQFEDTLSALSKDVRRFNLSKMKDDVDNYGKRMNTFITHTDLKQLKLDLLDTVQVN